ncbi:hypothetical protein DXT97_12610 [Agrobacterium tumefaciens]|uniref:hypothetical protein n=1 Tax=Agrobacterium tumefaciens TaxID=358 RepID=UPI00046EC1CE|nr:hypothetical protein [Agrobacterium tumefaciens]MQB37634.1 hypothetical protein [Agrobacterium tumefaciens]
MSETDEKMSHNTASQHFQDFIKDSFFDDTRPAEIRHIAEVYQNLISVLDCVFAIGQAVEMMPLTSEQRYHLEQMRGPLQKLMHGIGSGVTNLAGKEGDENGNS